jgi:uncharacterized protein (TIGR02118 family)
MIKLIALGQRKPELTRKQYLHHWQEVHAPLAQRISCFRRYVQSHCLPEDMPDTPPAPYDGVAEVWFDDLQTALSLGENPEYLEGAYLDEPNFAAPNAPFLLAIENVVVPGPELEKDTDGVKAIVLAKRKPGLSVEEFQAYWRDTHAPLVPKTPGLRRYVQCHLVPEMYANGEPAYDGVAELTWPDLASFEAGWRSEEMQVEQFTDVRNFIDLKKICGLLAKEVRIIWP